MSTNAGRPVRAAFVQAQSRLVTENDEEVTAKAGPSKLESDEEIEEFVQQAYNDVNQRRNKQKAKVLRETLLQSRNVVLARRNPQPPSMFRRLPSNACSSWSLLSRLYCQPCQSVSNEPSEASTASTAAESSHESGVAEVTVDTTRSGVVRPFEVRMRGGPKHKTWKVSFPSAIFLEGAHEPRPSSSATIFLKTHYATEDDQTLKYVPYFGDDDKDDVVSDLYNLEDREKQMEFGPEYQERDTNDVIDETLLLMRQQMQERGFDEKCDDAVPESEPLQRRINDTLADIMDEYRSRIHERYDKVCNEESKQPSKVEAPTKKPAPKRLESYLDAMDTYRPLFCRRCFVYDCNMHGNLNKPSLEVQGELAIQKDREGFWIDEDGMEEPFDDGRNLPSFGQPGAAYASLDENAQLPSTDSNAPAQPSDNTRKSQGSLAGQKRPRVEMSTATEKAPQGSLTLLQKAICARVFLMFGGDLDKVSIALGAPRDLVANHVESNGIKLGEFKHLKVDQTQPPKKKGRKTGKFGDQSMNNYNVAWLKRVEDAEIHPFFVPCDHEGPCDERVCSCIQNAFFCTKHCVWERMSRNFFRGCACNGKCTTKSCSCFAAKRECDPDLCRTCGACTDPPNKPATKQRCRNDNIGMRRHCHLMLGKSSIEDAGWGIYTRHALKKGDFVHEYVGEVISQEEAERRGRIYDKVNRSYLFNLCSDFVVDASRKGNKSRFANHSSKPNCYTKMVNVNGDIRIGLFAKDDIEAQSELTFDYRYDVGMDNDLIIKPGMTVDWMKNPKMANKISKKTA